MRRHRSRALLSLLALCWALVLVPSAAFAQAASAGEIDRLTNMIVKIMPMGAIFEEVAKSDPAWPMQDKPGAVTPEQLACMRSELSMEGYRRGKRTEVEAYATAHASRLTSDLALLENGAADLLGRLVMAGVEAEKTGIEVDSNAVMKSATAEQLLSFMTFFSDPKYAELRNVSGLGNAMGLTKSAEENEAVGKQLGSSLAVQQMVKSMGTCEVPPSVIFE